MYRGIARYRRDFAETATRLCSPHKGALASENPISFLPGMAKQFLPKEEPKYWNYRDLLNQQSLSYAFEEQSLELPNANDQINSSGYSYSQLEKGGSVYQNGPMRKEVLLDEGSEAPKSGKNGSIDIGQKLSEWRSAKRITEEQPVVQRVEYSDWGIAREASLNIQSEFAIKAQGQIKGQFLAAVNKAVNDNNVFIESGVFETQPLAKKAVPKEKAQ